MIELRPAESDEDLEAWRSVRSAVLPNERTSSVAELRAGADGDTLWLLAYVDGELAGSGVSTGGSTGGAFTQPRVLPAFRRRGVGTQLAARARRPGTRLRIRGRRRAARGAGFGGVRSAVRLHRAEPSDRAGVRDSRRRARARPSRRDHDRAAPRPGRPAGAAVPGARRGGARRPCRRPADRDHRGGVVVELDPVRRMGLPRARGQRAHRHGRPARRRGPPGACREPAHGGAARPSRARDRARAEAAHRCAARRTAG